MHGFPNSGLNFGGTVPTGAVRQTLLANRAYYVRPDGNDANNGLANNAGGAFATLQRAVNAVQSLDLNGFDVTVQAAAGTFTAGVTFGRLTGPGTATLIGDNTTPANCLISTTGVSPVRALFGSRGWKITGFKLVAVSAFYDTMLVDQGSFLTVGVMDFGAAGVPGSYGSHISVLNGSFVVFDSSYSITGAASNHWFTRVQAGVSARGMTITLTGTPAFGSAFAYVSQGSLFVPQITFVGAATGSRFAATAGGVIDTFNAGATYFPGDSAGTEDTANGGFYN